MPFILALALGLVLTPLAARVGPRVGLVDHPTGDELKIHAEPKPLTGGLAVVSAVLVAAAATGHVEAEVAIAVVILVVVGAIDDVVSLPQLVRLTAQLVAGGVLAAGGLEFGPLGAFAAAAVVLAVPATANSVNMVDGQDGLAGGLAAAAALGITAILAAHGDAGALGPALIGALLAFGVWNRPPAKVFLGDGGAYAIGGLLAAMGAQAARSWPALLGVALCLSVFALELCSSVIRRAVRRESLIGGDRAHGYDLLASRLSSRTWSTAILVGSGLLVAALGRLALELPAPAGAAVLVAVAAAGSAGVIALWRTGPGYGVRGNRTYDDDPLVAPPGRPTVDEGGPMTTDVRSRDGMGDADAG